MEILALGFNHEGTPVAVRERLAVPADRLGERLNEVLALPLISEAFLVSTCNRTELYVVHLAQGAGGRTVLTETLLETVGAWANCPVSELQAYAYIHQGVEAARHLMRVAAGLDSMILGETQILGQVREAYQAAQAQRSVGKLLHALCEQALATAKRIHHETDLAQGAVSVASAAVELARKIHGRSTARRAVVVGAGEMGELVVRHLLESRYTVTLLSRQEEHARRVAQPLGASWGSLAELGKHLMRTHLVVTAASGGLLLGEADLRQARSGATHSLCLIDLAMPRNVAPACAALPDIYLYDLDDLKQVVAGNLAERARRAEAALQIVDEQAEAFGAWLRTLDVVPIIRSLREKAEAIRLQELEKALGRLSGLDVSEREIVAAMSQAIVNKLLNDPTVRLKELAAEHDDAPRYMETLSRLFNLKAHEPPRPEQAGD